VFSLATALSPFGIIPSTLSIRNSFPNRSGSIAKLERVKKEVQKNIYRARTLDFLEPSFGRLRDLEFELGLRSLIDDYKKKNIRIRDLLHSCIWLSRKLLDT
jgi:hypothetical protein